MAAKRVFVSFNHDANLHHKNMLLSWNKNREVEFALYEASLRDVFDSSNGDFVRWQIKGIIEPCSHVLFLIGERCSRSKWVAWESQIAFELGKPVAAVKAEQSCLAPKVLENDAVKWAPSFTWEAVRAAIESSSVPAPPQAAEYARAAARAAGLR